MKNQILIVTSEFPPQPGGIGNHAYNLALQLSKHGYSVMVIADNRSVNGIEEHEFDKSLPFKVKRTAVTSPRFFMYFLRLLKLFKLSRGLDVIIASGKFSLWSVALLSLFRKADYLAVTHGTELNFKVLILKTLTNWSLGRFDDIIAVSHYTKQLMANLSLRSITVIPNGHDSSKWQNDIIPVTLSGHPKIITVGNVTERKGQGNVIALLPNLIHVFPEIHYHCVGIPTEIDRFRALANRIDVQNHVTFHGRLSDADLQAMLMDADVCVMFSGETVTGDVEGFGIALLEANALGVPVIAALGSGVEDAVSHGYSGFLVRLKDYTGFGDALKILLQERPRFSQQSIEWANRFKWELVVKRYISLLEVVKKAEPNL